MKLDKQKKRILLAILVVAFIQMPGLALTPGINQIKTTAFTEYSLSSIQTALSVSGFAQPIAAFGAALLINKRIISKKHVIFIGLILLAATGALAMFAHTRFWHLAMLSTLLGISTGFFMSNMFGLIFDNYNESERQSIVGWQTSVINAGGIAMSLTGGLLASYIWYGGYTILLSGLPAAILVAALVPNYKSPPKKETRRGVARNARTGDNDKEIAPRTTRGINPKVYYYSAAALLFFMSYSVCGNNLSTHIAKLGNSATTGIASAFQMGGGVCSGLIFGNLSKKMGDYSLSIALICVSLGFMLLSYFATSLLIVFIAVFIVGMALSIMLPRCIFMVSTLATDKSTSATATALVSVVSPSIGAFLSPIVYTNLTTTLFGDSTSARYSFVGFVVLAIAIAITAITAAHRRRRGAS